MMTQPATFAECPDCGRHLHLTDDLYWCGTEGHDPLAPVDVYLEWNERAVLADDGQGLALAVVELDVEEED